MTVKNTHDYENEVQSISGWYEITKEDKIEFNGKEFLYLVGNGVVDSSCCGVGGCFYAVIPGSIVSWKSEKNEEGKFVSILETVKDNESRNALRKLLTKNEGVTQVQFW